MDKNAQKYAGFGRRLLALIIDNVIFSLLLSPIFVMLFNSPQYTNAELETLLKTQGLTALMPAKQLLIQQAVMLSITVFFWIRYAGTPGKRLLKIKVVDAQTGNKLTLMQSTVRYLGYFVSSLPMLLGFFWMLVDKKNQCWHDKLANSVVVTDSAALLDSPTPTETPDRDDDHFAA